jgi:hypothetical protein
MKLFVLAPTALFIPFLGILLKQVEETKVAIRRGKSMKDP